MLPNERVVHVAAHVRNAYSAAGTFHFGETYRQLALAQIVVSRQISPLCLITRGRYTLLGLYGHYLDSMGWHRSLQHIAVHGRAFHGFYLYLRMRNDVFRLRFSCQFQLRQRDFEAQCRVGRVVERHGSCQSAPFFDVFHENIAGTLA